ncbi:unnamed protein product [Parnassius apollo]|uniref:(apollo) hypothetical protein n=1 Tax=Parnassius apollo TaxID=110799 RepID=A0A8S3WLX2_PARAO|nr:unnamed protein product [Parnassius apollo]
MLLQNSRAAKILRNIPPEKLSIEPGCYAVQCDNSMVLEDQPQLMIRNDGSHQGSTNRDSASSIPVVLDSDLQSSITECVTLNPIETVEPVDISTPRLSQEHTKPGCSMVLTDNYKVLRDCPFNILINNDRSICRRSTSQDSLKSISSVSLDSDLTSSETVEQTITTSSPPPRKRQKKSEPRQWDANKNKEQREKAKAYLGKKKRGNKWGFIEPKPVREMKSRCKCKLSLKGDTKMHCDKIPEEERQTMFEKFWKMSWKEKKVFVKMSSISKKKERERCAGTSSRWKNSVELYLTDSTGIRFRVCKTMFLNSLGVGEWVIKKWIINEDDPKDAPKNNTKVEAKNQLRKFFDSMPKLESHYCRKDSSKLYPEPVWTSTSQLYETYRKDFCVRENLEPLSITTFFNMFEALNLSLFSPKKDLCDICESYKAGNVSDIDYKTHRDKKHEARKELAKDISTEHEVLTMDLQSVLLSPRSNVSAL